MIAPFLLLVLAQMCVAEKKLSQNHNLTTQGIGPWLQCFDNSNFQGNSFTTTKYVPNLDSLGFDNRIESCIVQGIWLFYDDVNYGMSTQRPNNVVYTYGDNNHYQMDYRFKNKASSIRYVGPDDGYRYNSLTLFHSQFFQSNEEYINKNYNSLLIGTVNSAIITGTSDWTVYELPFYGGIASCLRANSNSDPAFITHTGGRRVGSVKQGCFSKSEVKGSYNLKQFGNSLEN